MANGKYASRTLWSHAQGRDTMFNLKLEYIPPNDDYPLSTLCFAGIISDGQRKYAGDVKVYLDSIDVRTLAKFITRGNDFKMEFLGSKNNVMRKMSISLDKETGSIAIDMFKTSTGNGEKKNVSFKKTLKNTAKDGVVAPHATSFVAALEHFIEMATEIDTKRMIHTIAAQPPQSGNEPSRMANEPLPDPEE